MAYDSADFIIETLPKITTPRENMTYLRDFLFANSHLFDYSNFTKGSVKCNTPACILGWARTFSNLWEDDEVYAWMGLNSQEGYRLCFAASTGSGIPGNMLTGIHAANVLDHYLATGEVDWSVA